VTVAPRMLRIDETSELTTLPVSTLRYPATPRRGTACLSAWSAPRVRRGLCTGMDCRAESGRSRTKAARRMNAQKRRGSVLGNRPSHDSIATRTLDGPRLLLSKHWIRYQEDQDGDFCESPDATLVRATRRATRDREGCGCVPR
jgi:hypothetical protein